jgi:hypothetical protein
MFRPTLFNNRKLGRAQWISHLYGAILCIAVFSFLLGTQLVSLARVLGHGDPYHVVHWTELGAASALASVILSAFQIHRCIRRLTNLDSEQKSDSARGHLLLSNKI